MKTIRPAKIVSAERMSDGVLIEFDDHQCAFYSASLLYATLAKAVAVVNRGPYLKVLPVLAEQKAR
jgi:hypothetical protein